MASGVGHGDDFWWFLGPLEPGYDPIFYSRRPMNDYLSLGHYTMYVPMTSLIQCMGDMTLMPKICEK